MIKQFIKIYQQIHYFKNLQLYKLSTLQTKNKNEKI